MFIIKNEINDQLFYRKYILDDLFTNYEQEENIWL